LAVLEDGVGCLSDTVHDDLVNGLSLGEGVLGRVRAARRSEATIIGEINGSESVTVDVLEADTIVSVEGA